MVTLGKSGGERKNQEQKNSRKHLGIQVHKYSWGQKKGVLDGGGGLGGGTLKKQYPVKQKEKQTCKKTGHYPFKKKKRQEGGKG